MAKLTVEELQAKRVAALERKLQRMKEGKEDHRIVQATEAHPEGELTQWAKENPKAAVEQAGEIKGALQRFRALALLKEYASTKRSAKHAE